MWLQPVSCTIEDASQEIFSWNCQSIQHHDVQFRGMCGQIHWSTMEAPHYGQQSIGHTALGKHPLWGIRLIDGRWPWYGYTNIQLHDVSSACYFQYSGRRLNVHPGSWNCQGSVAVMRWTNWYLLCSCVAISDVFGEAPANRLDLDRLSTAEVVVYPSFACVE